jgi:cellulose synthase/poly-beta-1,6-N-acetylglucosamine synthase-like glycosyltransferase
MNELPNISLLMPIYNRSKFKRLIISNLLKLNYDLSKLEFVVDDDSDTDPLFKTKEEENEFKVIIAPIKLSYYKNTIKRQIGAKRNFLTKHAKYDICANIDSDDIYFSDYLIHSLEVMKQGKYKLVGSPEMLFCFPNDDFLVTGIRCPAKRMNHEATFVYTKKYWKAMGGYANKCSQGEGVSMIDGMSDKLVGKTDIRFIMMCICWEGNTIKKDRFKDSEKIDAKLDIHDKQMISETLNL